MGKNYFRTARGRMSDALVVPMFLLFSLMLVIGLGIMFEDVSTTYYGYISLPTHKVNNWVNILISIAPTAVEIGMTYAYLSDRGNRWGYILAALLFMFDTGTDVAYKVGNSTDPFVWLLAIAESIIVFSVLSEGMTTLSIGMLNQLWPDFVKKVGPLVKIPKMFDEDDDEGDDDPVPARRPVAGSTMFTQERQGPKGG